MTNIAHIKIKHFHEIVGHYEEGNRMWLGLESSFENTVEFEGETEVDFINAANKAISLSEYRYGSDTRYEVIPIIDEMSAVDARYGDVLLVEYDIADQAELFPEL